MSKFIVLFGKNTTPGTAGTRYEIFDTVEFPCSSETEEEMRKYTYRKFFEMGKRASRLRHDVFCRRRHIILDNGRIFAESVKIFDHESSNEYFAFVPVESFWF